MERPNIAEDVTKKVFSKSSKIYCSNENVNEASDRLFKYKKGKTRAGELHDYNIII